MTPSPPLKVDAARVDKDEDAGNGFALFLAVGADEPGMICKTRGLVIHARRSNIEGMAITKHPSTARV